MPRRFVLAAVWLALAPITALASAEGPPPNFVVIFIDDMGYGDIGPFGSEINHTPNLDRMADEGMKLTSFYVAAPVCTPSRAALMTGCYPKRVGLAKGSFHAVLFPGDKHGLHPDEITIAEVLGEAGYATGCFGKWHLGDQPQFLPTSQGFDEYFGLPYSNDMWHGHTGWEFTPLPLVRGVEAVGEVKTMEDQAQLCKQFTDEAVAFIRRNKDRPFFAYLPHAFIHHPRAAREPFLARSKNPDRVTGAQIDEVDWSVGQVLDALRALELDRRTLVVFTSDNGGARGCVNRPLRGGKGSAFEGGMREPTLAWWPDEIPAGSVCGELVTAMDLLPTFARLAGARVPQDRIIDGKNVVDLLRARPGAKSPHDQFFYYRGNNLAAVRSGPWKLFADGRLFNLDQDIAEAKNIAAKHPDVVARLEKLLAGAREDLGDGEKPGKNCRPVGLAHNPRVILPRPGVAGDAAYAPVGPEQRRR
jgi:arylsulfatase A-like enzyme